MPRMAAEAGCAAMAGTAPAIAAGTGPAETGATCVFGGASAAAQASVAAARRNARAIVLEPARAVRGLLVLCVVSAAGSFSLVAARQDKAAFQARHACGATSLHDEALPIALLRSAAAGAGQQSFLQESDMRREREI